MVNPWKRPRKTWVYDLLEDGVVVYVGNTNHPQARFKQHLKSGIAKPTTVMRVISEHDNELEAWGTEALRIDRLRPKLNKMSGVGAHAHLGIELPDHPPALTSHLAYLRTAAEITADLATMKPRKKRWHRPWPP